MRGLPSEGEVGGDAGSWGDLKVMYVSNKREAITCSSSRCELPDAAVGAYSEDEAVAETAVVGRDDAERFLDRFLLKLFLADRTGRSDFDCSA